MTAHYSRTYLAWANSYSRLLRQLGMQGVAEKPLTLAEHLARRAQQASAASGALAATDRCTRATRTRPSEPWGRRLTPLKTKDQTQ